MEALLFYIIGLTLILSCLAIVWIQDVLQSALFLIFTMLQIAILYCLYQAQFLAVIQVMVYAGAIMVLFLFIIMLLPREQTLPKGKKWHFFSAPIGFALIFSLEFYLLAKGNSPEKIPDFSMVQIEWFAKKLFSDYLWAFEMVSFVLLVAVIGVVLLSRPDEKEKIVD